MPTMSSCSLMSSTQSLIPITHQCNVSQESLHHNALLGLFLYHSPKCAACTVQCNNALRCVKCLGERAVCGAGSISHFLPRMETRGRTHQQMGSCTALRKTAILGRSFMYQVKKEGFDQQLPFSPRQSIFSAPAFDDLIRSGNNLGCTPAPHQT